MKHLILLSYLFFVSSFVIRAQSMPYNPDANADDLIGVEDILGVLTLYGNELFQTDLQCDYEGTEFEELVIGVMDGSIILDSIYVEYHILDTFNYYTPGCADLVVDPVVLERSYMMIPEGFNHLDELIYHYMGIYHFSFYRKHIIVFSGETNKFQMYLRDYEVEDLPNYSGFSYMADEEETAFSLPFPDEFILDENGFQCFGRPHDFANEAETFKAIPFWHYLMEGCTDPSYIEFDPEASDDDGSCITPIVTGCLDSAYAEFNPAANTDDGSCATPITSEWQCGDSLFYWGDFYATVEIDNQCWFAENLRSLYYSNGSSIQSDVSSSTWSSLVTGAAAIYGDGNGSCTASTSVQNACDLAWSLENFGRLYNWYAVADERALCPVGWHVPSKEEFEALFDFLGGAPIAGDALKSANGMWDNSSIYVDVSNNESGFAGLPGGHRDASNPTYWNAGGEGFWWCSAFESNMNNVYWVMALGSGYSPAQVYLDAAGSGFSVRCIKDSEE